jgi:hypothetical protein
VVPFLRVGGVLEYWPSLLCAGDNIMQKDCEDPIASLHMAFAPAIEAGVPWAAVLGNHDQEGNLSREGVMSYITSMDYTVSRVNPSGDGCESAIDGFGNFVLEIFGAEGSPQEDKSVLNLYLVDSGDYAPLSKIGGYGWIHETQSTWIKKVAKNLQVRELFIAQVEVANFAKGWQFTF